MIVKKVTKKNLESLYYNPKGNLYYAETNGYNTPDKFQIVDGFSYEEVYEALLNNVMIIYVEV